MNIIQISASDYGGGVETVVRLHHSELVRQNHATHVLVGKKKGTDDGFDQIPLRPGPKGMLRTANWFQRKTGLQNLYSPSFRGIEQSFRFSPDVLHIHSLHGAESYAELRFAGKLIRRYPAVITLHDYWLMTGHCGYPLDCPGWLKGCGNCPDLERYPSVPKDGTKFNFRRKRSLFADANVQLIVPSQFLKTEVEKSLILQHLPITVVLNPIDHEVFHPGDGRRRRAEFGIEDDAFVIMMIANNLKNIYKGIDDGVKALQQLSDQNVTVVVVGRGADEIARKVPMKTIGLPYTSDTADLVSYYQLADLLLMPSRCETFGLVAGESMACGTPVVCFDAGALAEVVGDASTGVVVPARDPKWMASEIDRIAADPERRRQMSAAGINRIRSEFALPRHSRNVVSVYEQAMSSLSEVIGLS
ncbi:MAG: glycosyltransferase [Planctomycetota bacterium]